MTKPDFTLGIEEEYMLVDLQTRELISKVPAGFFEDCHSELGEQVTREFLQCQIEIGTRVCKNTLEAREELRSLRKAIIDTAKKYDIGVIAASTHPFSASDIVRHTEKPRYEQLADDLQAVVRRLQICGMHIHCGLNDDDLRIDFMGQVSYILPHLLSLTTSSPFWHGQNSGLKSYRLAVWDEMPRTGLPEHFDSYSEYMRHVDILVQTGVIEDATKVWWDIRPSARYQTLEMRISDVCTRIDDAVAVAAVYQCWLHMLYRLKKYNMRWREYSQMLVNENRWRAQRYGIDKGLIDFGSGIIKPYHDLIEEMIDLLSEDAEILGCQKELLHIRDIVKNGTSAHRQVRSYETALANGASEKAALIAVVDDLLLDTQHGL